MSAALTQYTHFPSILAVRRLLSVASASEPAQDSDTTPRRLSLSLASTEATRDSPRPIRREARRDRVRSERHRRSRRAIHGAREEEPEALFVLHEPQAEVARAAGVDCAECCGRMGGGDWQSVSSREQLRGREREHGREVGDRGWGEGTGRTERGEGEDGRGAKDDAPRGDLGGWPEHVHSPPHDRVAHEDLLSKTGESIISRSLARPYNFKL